MGVYFLSHGDSQTRGYIENQSSGLICINCECHFQVAPFIKTVIREDLGYCVVDTVRSNKSIIAPKFETWLIGCPFHGQFLIEIQIRWKFGFSVTPLLGNISLQILHVSRQYSCRATCKISWRSLWYHLDESRIFLIEFEILRQNVREMAPVQHVASKMDFTREHLNSLRQKSIAG